MRKCFALVVLLIGCTACAGPPVHYPGTYDRTDHVYRNETVGFRLTMPRHWEVVTKRRDFTVHDKAGIRSNEEGK